MTIPVAGTFGWFQYDPKYNAPLTPAELDLFNRLQAGDPVLRASYEQQYGPIDPATGTGGWYDAWTHDQDYWNLRYLNQLAPPEEMARFQQSTAGKPYPYSIFVSNSLRKMQLEGTLDTYLAAFKDPNFASYLAFTSQLQYNPTQAPGPQPTGPTTPTFTPTETGQGVPQTATPPTPYGPIPPAPSTPTGGGNTVPVNPVATVPQGTGAPGTTPTGGTVAPGGGPMMQSLGGIPVWAWALGAVLALILFARRGDAG